MTDDKTRGERRAETARRNDDSATVESTTDVTVPAAGQQGREGGNLQRDVATQAELAGATNSNPQESVTKGDHIAHGQGQTPPHPAQHVVTERD